MASFSSGPFNLVEHQIGGDPFYKVFLAGFPIGEIHRSPSGWIIQFLAPNQLSAFDLKFLAAALDTLK